MVKFSILCVCLWMLDARFMSVGVVHRGGCDRICAEEDLARVVWSECIEVDSG